MCGIIKWIGFSSLVNNWYRPLVARYHLRHLAFGKEKKNEFQQFTMLAHSFAGFSEKLMLEVFINMNQLRIPILEIENNNLDISG